MNGDVRKTQVGARCDVVNANFCANGEGGGRFLQGNGKKIRKRFKRDVEARGDVFLLVLPKIGPLQCFGIDGCLVGEWNVSFGSLGGGEVHDIVVNDWHLGVVVVAVTLFFVL